MIVWKGEQPRHRDCAMPGFERDRVRGFGFGTAIVNQPSHRSASGSCRFTQSPRPAPTRTTWSEPPRIVSCSAVAKGRAVGASCRRQQRQYSGSSVRQQGLLRRGISPGWIVSDQRDQRSARRSSASAECPATSRGTRRSRQRASAAPIETARLRRNTLRAARWPICSSTGWRPRGWC